MTKKPVETVKLNLRIREGLRKRLERDAKRNNLSLNSEMVSRLETSFSKDEREILIDALVGGEPNASLLRMIALKMQILQLQNPDWRSDKDARTRFVHSLAADLIKADDMLLAAPDDQEAKYEWLMSNPGEKP